MAPQGQGQPTLSSRTIAAVPFPARSSEADPFAAGAVLAIIRAAWVHETQDLPPEAEAALWRLLVCARGPAFEIPADERAQAQVAKVDLRSWRRVIRPALGRFLLADPPRVHALPFLAGYYRGANSSTDAAHLREDGEHARSTLDRGAGSPSRESQGAQPFVVGTGTMDLPAMINRGGASGPAWSDPHTPTHPPVLPPLTPSLSQIRTDGDELDIRFYGWSSDEFFEWLYANHPRPRYRRAAHRRWRHLQVPDGDVESFERIAQELERWTAITWNGCEPQHVKDLWGWLENRPWEDHA